MDRTTYVKLDLRPVSLAFTHAARPRGPDGDHLELDFDRAGIFGEPMSWALTNVRFTSILLKNPLLWRPHFGFVALSGRQIPGSPPHVAKMGVGSGMSFASFRRFWAVAANRNSSLAPFGPRSRNRPSLSMRLR
jgi:hypothetical protein